jgi:hypothetical protein
MAGSPGADQRFVVVDQSDGGRRLTRCRAARPWRRQARRNPRRREMP